MATKKTAGLPKDWQKLVLETMEQMQKDDVAKAIFGLRFPEKWKPHLLKYVRNGEVRRMFKLRAISFGGTTIERFDDPNLTKSKKAS